MFPVKRDVLLYKDIIRPVKKIKNHNVSCHQDGPLFLYFFESLATLKVQHN